MMIIIYLLVHSFSSPFLFPDDSKKQEDKMVSFGERKEGGEGGEGEILCGRERILTVTDSYREGFFFSILIHLFHY